MDAGWRFAFGNATDPGKDFDPVPFNNNNYFAKAGNAVGAAAMDFDDRTWRTLNLPHDWAVELPFDSRGAGSHGYKAIGRNFPQNSVGWYRKPFTIPNSDLGKKISLEFDGVFRDSIVWVNGFYLGRETSGYNSFNYDLTDYLNYGGNNVVAVRAWDPKDQAAVRRWFEEYLRWLTHSKNGIDARRSGDNNASWWTVQVAAVATFVENRATQQMAFNYYRDRILLRQIRADGSAPLVGFA